MKYMVIDNFSFHGLYAKNALHCIITYYTDMKFCLHVKTVGFSKVGPFFLFLFFVPSLYRSFKAERESGNSGHCYSGQTILITVVYIVI